MPKLTHTHTHPHICTHKHECRHEQTQVSYIKAHMFGPPATVTTDGGAVPSNQRRRNTNETVLVEERNDKGDPERKGVGN